MLLKLTTIIAFIFITLIINAVSTLIIYTNSDDLRRVYLITVSAIFGYLITENLLALGVL